MTCPCGLPRPYAECCGRFHTSGHTSGTASPDVWPETAELLMRSRYSAFVVRDADYLLRTWHKATRPSSLVFEPDAPVWTGLEILGTTGGSAKDVRGTVDFVARFTQDGEAGEQRENSSFRRQGGNWVYVGVLT